MDEEAGLGFRRQKPNCQRFAAHKPTLDNRLGPRPRRQRRVACVCTLYYYIMYINVYTLCYILYTYMYSLYVHMHVSPTTSRGPPHWPDAYSRFTTLCVGCLVVYHLSAGKSGDIAPLGIHRAAIAPRLCCQTDLGFHTVRFTGASECSLLPDTNQ